MIQTPSGTAVSGATIDVYNAGGTVHATIYSDDGITSTSNPLTSASDGTFGFYVADGRYDLKVSGTGITTRTFSDVEIFDATEKNAADGTLTATAANFTTLTVTGNETVGGTLQVTGATTLNSGALNGTFTGSPTFSGTPTFSSGAALAGTFSGNPTFSGNITATAGQNSLSAFKFNSLLFVDGIKYTTIQAAINDISAGGGTVVVPPNYVEVLTSNLVISKSNTCLQFTGPATITLGAFSVTMASGINNVSIITPYIHGGTNSSDGGVTFTGYTGSGSAMSFGDSSGAALSLLLRGFNINLNTGALANAVAITLTNIQNSAVEYSGVTFGGVAGQKGIRLLGTGAFFCGLINIAGAEFNSSASATNNTGIYVDEITNSVNIYGGHCNMGGGANGSAAIDVKGNLSSGVVSFGFDADVCQTAVKVESIAATGFWGFVRCDSGATNIANFAAGSNGNVIWTNGNLPFTDNGTSGTNSIINPGRNNWRTDVWQNQVGATFSFFYKDLLDSGNSRLIAVNGVAGRTDVNSGSGAGSVNLQWDQGTGGVQFGNGDTTAHMTVSGAGLITKYNTIATVSNGVPSEVATVDSTGLNAAVGTTTLYAVPASGAGQYRLSWDSKITTVAGVSSTLGALTVVYTDPDGNAITITAGALQIGGTVATTVTTNSVSTAALYGIPLLLNCKASTNITYAMAYASNAANAMVYNLHLKLEAM